MTQILEYLDEYLCSQCHKYLSVVPVKVYEDGTVKCGRCNTNDDGGVESLYGEMAQQCVFKCVNRYEGCQRLLFPSDVLEHEKNCTSTSYNCPSCNINPPLTVLQLLQHFKQSHSDHVLKNNILSLTLSGNVTKVQYLYVQDDIIFIIFLRYVSDYLYIGAVTLGDIKNVKQQFIIIKDSLAFQHVTEISECASLRNFSTDDYFKIELNNRLNQLLRLEIILDTSKASIHSYEIQLSKGIIDNIITVKNVNKTKGPIELTPEFKTVFPDYKLTSSGFALYSDQKKKRIELQCSNCEEVVSIGIYVCQLNDHTLCYDCKAWCGLCECPLITLSSSSNMLQYLLFFCRWNCGYKYNGLQIRNHEDSCYKNQLKCIYCLEVMTAEYFKSHLSDIHDIKYLIFGLQRLQSSWYCYIFKNKLLVITSQIEIVQQNVTRCKLTIKPYDDMTGLKLCIIVRNNCFEVKNNQITVRLEDKPVFYLKYLH